ncbi:MAG: hypothetical protein NTZ49_01940 [Candidatus Parcubacteria bacterium]|nr:hypothetical protein [Candidatus Parcubacteria bacterium]
MKKFFVIMFLLVVGFTVLAQAEPAQPPPASNQPGVLPNVNVIVPPYLWIDNFVTGENGILEHHVANLRLIQEWLRDNPSDIAALIGMVSDLKIRGYCYYNYSTGFYSLKYNQAGSTVNQGDRVCQEALSLSRAISIRNWLLTPQNWLKDKQGNPIKIDEFRIRILDVKALGLRGGGNFPNQSVAVWMLSFNQAKQGPGILTLTQGPPAPVPTPEIAPRRRPKTTIYTQKIDP